MSDKEKNYTLKNVQNELKKRIAARDAKCARMKALKASIKEDTKHIKELDALCTTLHHEELQRQIATALFKEQRLTPSQITKLLQLSGQIHNQLDTMDVDAAAEAVKLLGTDGEVPHGTEK